MPRIQASFLLLAAMPAILSAAFEPNRGQSSRSTQFLTRHNGVLFRATTDGMEFQAPGAAPMRITLHGIKGAWLPEAPTNSTLSYRIGADPRRWIEQIPTYNRLRRPGALPGVDWVVYFNQGKLEYDFEVQDASRLSQITLETSGPTLNNDDGVLSATLGAYHLTQRPPRFFASGRELRGHLKSIAPGAFQFQIDEAAPQGPLRIDPIVEITGVAGGPGDDQLFYVNNSIAVGSTRSAAWDLAPSGSGVDIFVRIHKSGAASRTIFYGGSGDDVLTAAAPSPTGTDIVFAQGYTSSRDLPSSVLLDPSPALPASAQSAAFGGGNSDALALTISASSIEAFTYGGEEDEVFHSHASAAPTSTNSFHYYAGEVRTGGASEGLIVYRLDSRSRAHRFPVPIKRLALSASSRFFYVLGDTSRDDLPGLNAAWHHRGGAKDIWIAALQQIANLDDALPSILWQGLWGGPADETAAGLIDLPNDGLYVVGNTNSDNIEHINPTQPLYGGGSSDGFILKLSTPSFNLERSTYFGGNGTDTIVDAASFLSAPFVFGSTTSTDWTFPGQPAGDPAGHGFAALISGVCAPEWGLRVGGAGDDRITSLSGSASGLWLAGITSDTSWLPALNAILPLNPVASSTDPAIEGMDTFFIRLRPSILHSRPIVVGTNLKAPVSLTSLLEYGHDGLVEVVSGDPSRILIAGVNRTPQLNVSTPRLVLANLTSSLAAGDFHFAVEAVGEPGESFIILRAAGMPDRRVPVFVLPSAIYVSSRSVFASAGRLASLSAFTAPLAAPGETPIPQSTRSGFEPWIAFEPDVASAFLFATPRAEYSGGYPAGYYQNFELRARGRFILVPRSPHFPTAPNQFVEVADDTTPLGQTQSILVAGQSLIQVLSLPAQRPKGDMTINVEDPGKLVLSLDGFNPLPSSITLPASVDRIYFQPLTASGTATIRFTGPDNWTASQQIQFVPSRVRFSAIQGPVVQSRSFLASATVSPMNEELISDKSAFPRYEAAYLHWQSIPSSLLSAFTFTAETLTHARLKSMNLSSDSVIATLEMISPGDHIVEWRQPPPYVPLGPNPQTVPTRASGIYSQTTEIVIPQGGRLYLPVSFDVPDSVRANLRQEFRDPGVAELILDYRTLTSPTFGLTPYSTLAIQAVGRPGQRTVLTLSGSGVKLEIPVRIVPFALLALQDEIRVAPSTLSLSFRPAAWDQATALNILSANAPPDIQVTAVSSDPSVCSVPASLTIQNLSTPPSISCTSQGRAELTFTPIGDFASSPPMRVRLNVALDPLLSRSGSIPRVILGSHLQTSFGLSPLGRDIDIATVEIVDADLALVSLNGATLGQRKITFNPPAKGFTSSIRIQGRGRTGATTIRVTSGAGDVFDIPLFVWRTSLVFDFQTGTSMPDPIRTSIEYVGPSPLRRSFALKALPVNPVDSRPVAASSGDWILLPTQPTALIRVASSNKDVADVVPPTPYIDASRLGSYPPLLLEVEIRSQGAATLEIEQPEGFVPSPFSRLVVEVTRPSLTVEREVYVAPGLQAPIVPFYSSSGSNAAISVTSVNPAILQLSDSFDGPSRPQISIQPGRVFYVRCLGFGEASLRLEAPGANSLTLPVAIESGQFRFNDYYPSWLSPGKDSDVYLTFQFATATARRAAGQLSILPDFGWRFEAVSSSPGLVEFPNGPEFKLFPNGGGFSLRLRAAAVGEGEISVRVLGPQVEIGPNLPVKVVPWTLPLSTPLNIGLGSIQQFSFRNYQSRSATFRIEPRGGIEAGLDAARLSTSPIEVEIPASAARDFYFGLPLRGSGSILWSAPNTVPFDLKVNPVNTGFILDLSNYPGSVLSPSAGTVAIPVQFALTPDSPYPASLNPSIGPQTVRLSSSNPDVAAFTASTITVSAGGSRATASLRILRPGTAILSVESPSGFTTGNPRRDFLITVR